MTASRAVLEELHRQLVPFCRAMTGDETAAVGVLEVMPGHAGFSYGFTIERENGELQRESFVLRLPPPNVRLEGTADVLRQVRVLGVVRGRGVPVVDIRWWGDDPRWFGRPFFVVPRLTGDTLRAAPGEWAAALDAETLREMARQAIAAMVALHALAWERTIPDWGPPLQPDDDVRRWDRFWERAADPELVRLGPDVRRLLLERTPRRPRMGIFHGDFQGTNLFYHERRLLAVIDWELAGVGPVLNDLGWFMLFNDAESWAHESRSTALNPSPREIERRYVEAAGAEQEDVAWYRALAGYKFSIIGGFNLMLHRRGKRDDPHWEELMPSIPRLMERALEVLDGA